MQLCQQIQGASWNKVNKLSLNKKNVHQPTCGWWSRFRSPLWSRWGEGGCSRSPPLAWKIKYWVEEMPNPLTYLTTTRDLLKWSRDPLFSLTALKALSSLLVSVPSDLNFSDWFSDWSEKNLELGEVTVVFQSVFFRRHFSWRHKLLRSRADIVIICWRQLTGRSQCWVLNPFPLSAELDQWRHEAEN